jgi:hypothetical protein
MSLRTEIPVPPTLLVCLYCEARLMNSSYTIEILVTLWIISLFGKPVSPGMDEETSTLTIEIRHETVRRLIRKGCKHRGCTRAYAGREGAVA